MIRYIDYKEDNQKVSVGFVKRNFVVYSQIAKDEKLSKEDTLQKLYEKVKTSIDYENKLYESNMENSIKTEKVGEEFIPEKAKAIKLIVDFQDLKGKVIDQYGELYSEDVLFIIENTNKAYIEGNKIIEEEVETDTKYILSATYEGLKESIERTISAREISTEEIVINIVNRQIEFTREEIASNYSSLEDLQAIDRGLLEAKLGIVELAELSDTKTTELQIALAELAEKEVQK